MWEKIANPFNRRKIQYSVIKMLSKIGFLFLLIRVYGQDSSDGSSNDFSYPCKSLDDLDCIRNYFASTASCYKLSHQDGEPIQKEKNVAYMPSINATLYSSPVGVIFYGSLVKSFYINKLTNNLVLSINFEGMNINSPKGNLKIDQRGQEPMYAEDTVNATYSGELTAIIPSAGLQGLDGVEVSSFNTNAYPPIEVGPKISQSSDPVVSKTFNALLADVPTIVQELLLSKAPYFFYVYFQHYICDFGVEFTGEAFH